MNMMEAVTRSVLKRSVTVLFVAHQEFIYVEVINNFLFDDSFKRYVGDIKEAFGAIIFYKGYTLDALFVRMHTMLSNKRVSWTQVEIKSMT